MVCKNARCNHDGNVKMTHYIIHAYPEFINLLKRHDETSIGLSHQRSIAKEIAAN